MKKVFIGIGIVVVLLGILVTKSFWTTECSGDICGAGPKIRTFPVLRTQTLCSLVGGRFRSEYNGWGGFNNECLAASEWRCTWAHGFFVTDSRGATCYQSDPEAWFEKNFPTKK